MNLRQLDAFRATLRTGSITEAAKTLGLSQPSVTRLIKELERSVGFTLFVRNGRGITSTVEGRRFGDAVESLFTGTDRLKETAQAIRTSTDGEVLIGVTPVLVYRYTRTGVTPMSTSPSVLVRMACAVSLSRSVPVKRLSTASPNRRPSTVDVMPRPLRTKRVNPTDRSSSLINRVTLGWDRPSVLAASVIEPVRRVARKASSCLRFIAKELYKNQIYCRQKCICQIYRNHRYWTFSGNRNS